MGEWQNGLFGCFSNCGTCIITYLAPCYTAGKNAEAVGEGCVLYGCLAILGPIGMYTRATIRGKIREQKGIEGGFGGDCIMAVCCGLCALVQEANEINSMGGQAQSMDRE